MCKTCRYTKRHQKLLPVENKEFKTGVYRCYWHNWNIINKEECPLLNEFNPYRKLSEEELSIHGISQVPGFRFTRKKTFLSWKIHPKTSFIIHPSYEEYDGFNCLCDVKGFVDIDWNRCFDNFKERIKSYSIDLEEYLKTRCKNNAD